MDEYQEVLFNVRNFAGCVVSCLSGLNGNVFLLNGFCCCCQPNPVARNDENTTRNELFTNNRIILYRMIFIFFLTYLGSELAWPLAGLTRFFSMF